MDRQPRRQRHGLGKRRCQHDVVSGSWRDPYTGNLLTADLAYRDRWPVGRTVSWFAGMAVIAWATFGGLGAYSSVLFSLHEGIFAGWVLRWLYVVSGLLGCAVITGIAAALPARRVTRVSPVASLAAD